MTDVPFIQCLPAGRRRSDGIDHCFNNLWMSDMKTNKELSIGSIVAKGGRTADKIITSRSFEMTSVFVPKSHCKGVGVRL